MATHCQEDGDGDHHQCGHHHHHHPPAESPHPQFYPHHIQVRLPLPNAILMTRTKENI